MCTGTHQLDLLKQPTLKRYDESCAFLLVFHVYITPSWRQAIRYVCRPNHDPQQEIQHLYCVFLWTFKGQSRSSENENENIVWCFEAHSLIFSHCSLIFFAFVFAFAWSAYTLTLEKLHHWGQIVQIVNWGTKKLETFGRLTNYMWLCV